MPPSGSGRPHRFLSIFFYLVALSVIAYFFINGFNYYSTPLDQRPFLDSYQTLKPGGFRSHGFGIIGSLMLILLLGYSVRKRFRFMRKMGVLRRWLNVHIFFGTIGPLLIILHSTFKLNGLVSVSFWAMIGVALSGVVGRYLYIQIPRTISGNELTKEEARDEFEELSKRIQNQFGLHSGKMANLPDLLSEYTDTEQKKSFGTYFVTNLTRYFRLRKTKKKLVSEFKIPVSQTRPLIKLIKQQVIIERRLRFWNIIHELFHYWHVIHKPFAVIMYIIMFVHIGIAVWLGYTWIF